MNDIHYPSAPWTILLVDDDGNVRTYLRKLLGRSFPHATFFEASNGREGMKVIHESRIDLAITDQRMPEMDGLSFVKLVRSASPTTARVILTGFADLDLVQRAINEGHVDAFFQKPAGGLAFTRAVGALLEAHHAIFQARSAFARASTLTRQAGAPYFAALGGEGGA